jgi:trans-aconitate 2-methyltransferase
MPDWDAHRYHRLSDPQVSWGRGVAERLAPAAGERILDLGCGTGRLTAEIAGAAPELFVVGIDRSAAMLSVDGGRPAPYARVRGDGAALPFIQTFDAVFTNAALHWIPDHEAVFRSVHRVLASGGRFVAQCGGAGNLRVLLDRTHDLMHHPRFGYRFRGWRDPWEFADVPTTRARLAGAGFEQIDVWLEPAPTTFDGPEAFADFISCVCVRRHVDRLPIGERDAFVGLLTEAAADDDPPYTLDYWRLNIVARKPGL